MTPVMAKTFLKLDNYARDPRAWQHWGKVTMGEFRKSLSAAVPPAELALALLRLMV
jgi:hypothetical protein